MGDYAKIDYMYKRFKKASLTYKHTHICMSTAFFSVLMHMFWRAMRLAFVLQ